MNYYDQGLRCNACNNGFLIPWQFTTSSQNGNQGRCFLSVRNLSSCLPGPQLTMGILLQCCNIHPSTGQKCDFFRWHPDDHSSKPNSPVLPSTSTLAPDEPAPSQVLHCVTSCPIQGCRMCINKQCVNTSCAAHCHSEGRDVCSIKDHRTVANHSPTLTPEIGDQLTQGNHHDSASIAVPPSPSSLI